MFKKLKSGKLSVIFIALLALVLIIMVVDNKKGDRTIPENLVETDTSDIVKLRISSLKMTEDVVLEKNNGLWKVNKEGELLAANIPTMNTIIELLTKLKPSAMITNRKESWTKYDVTDSLATRLEVFNKKKKVSDLMIGRFDYKPAPNSQYGRQSQQFSGTIKTFIKPYDEKEVYIVNEFLAMALPPELNSYRDKTILKLRKGDVNSIAFEYPADSSFVLTKSNGKWMIDGLSADSTSVANYLQGISNISGTDFTDDKSILSPEYKLTINGDNMIAPVVISGVNTGISGMKLHSSLNNDAVFNDPQGSKANKVFVSKKIFATE